MTGANAFLSQLRPGELVLWDAPGSVAVRDAARRRRQRRGLIYICCFAGLAGISIWFAYDDWRILLSQPSIALAIEQFHSIALLVLTLAWGVISVRFWLLNRSLDRLTSSWQFHYVLTDQRLFCVDETGDRMEEIEGHEIVGVELEEEPPATVLVERRVWEDEEDRYLILTHLEQPHIAKTKIEQTFLESAP